VQKEKHTSRIIQFSNLTVFPIWATPATTGIEGGKQNKRIENIEHKLNMLTPGKPTCYLYLNFTIDHK
jgi:hypothetical protein